MVTLNYKSFFFIPQMMLRVSHTKTNLTELRCDTTSCVVRQHHSLLASTASSSSSLSLHPLRQYSSFLLKNGGSLKSSLCSASPSLTSLSLQRLASGIVSSFPSSLLPVASFVSLFFSLPLFFLLLTSLTAKKKEKAANKESKDSSVATAGEGHLFLHPPFLCVFIFFASFFVICNLVCHSSIGRPYFMFFLYPPSSPFSSSPSILLPFIFSTLSPFACFPHFSSQPYSLPHSFTSLLHLTPSPHSLTTHSLPHRSKWKICIPYD